MRYGERTDAELMAAAQAGVAPAFAVLLHRHGPAVYSAVLDDPDPVCATRDVFVTALDELPRMDPAFPVRAWLLDIAGVDGVPDPIMPLAEADRDAIWASVVANWPGRPRPARPGLRRAALVGGLVALAALVPTLVVLAGEQQERPAEELRAQPVLDQAAVETEPDDVEAYPTFTFPTLPEEDPAPTPTPTSTPEPEPSPTATAEPEPSPTPTVTVSPEPSPEPTEEPEPEPTDEPEPEPTESPIDPPIDPDPSLPGDGDGQETP